MTDESQTTAPVGGSRFGHHPDPANDFCIEVEALEGLAHDVCVGLVETDPAELDRRISSAMEFRVGGDIIAVLAKQHLRRLEGSRIAGRFSAAALTRPAADRRGDAGVPAGWKLVPVEPTQEMIAALRDETASAHGHPITKSGAQEHWSIMLAAAPPPPAPEGLVDGRHKDLVRLLNVLGLGDHARPMSPAKVFDLCLEEICALRATLDATLSGQTGGAVPGAGGPVGPGVEALQLEVRRWKGSRDVHVKRTAYYRKECERLETELARLTAQPGGSPADPRLSGLEHAEHIADHWHQRFLMLHDKARPGTAARHNLWAMAEGAKQVLDDIKAERARLAKSSSSEPHP